jgi:uncharacterized protein
VFLHGSPATLLRKARLPADFFVVTFSNDFRTEFDPAKSERNLILRGLSFDRVDEFQFSTALIDRDTRHVSEDRFIALGWLSERLHVLIFTPRGEVLRIISFRRANQRENRRYQTWLASL